MGNWMVMDVTYFTCLKANLLANLLPDAQSSSKSQVLLGRQGSIIENLSFSKN